MKAQKRYHTVRRVTKSIKKNLETDKIDTLNT